MEQARAPRVGGPPRAEKNYLNAAAKKQEEWHLRLRASHLKAVKGGPSLPSRHSLPLALGLYPEDIAPRTDHCYSSRDAAASLSHRKQLTASTPLADALASAQSSRLLAEASAAAAPQRWSRGPAVVCSSGPRGHPPLQRPAHLRGAALWPREESPRRLGAEARLRRRL